MKKRESAKKKRLYTKKKQHTKKKLYRKKKQTKKINYKGGSKFDENFLLCYDSNLLKIRSAINKYSGQHYIDPTISQQFIDDQLTEVRRQAARDLIENTIYITLQDVSDIIKDLIIKLYGENSALSSEESDIYMFTGNPNKSFYFISILALSHIRELGFKQPKYFITSLDNEVFDQIGNNPLLIFDDVSYSGSQLSEMLNKIYYERVIEKGRECPSIFILLIALNHFSKRKLEKVPIKKFISRHRSFFNEFTTSPFKLLYLEDRLYTPLIINLGIERYFYLNLFFSLYTQDHPYVSIYLDHKLADAISTYKSALMYGPIVPSNYNYTDIFSDFYDCTPKELTSDEIITLVNKFNSENDSSIKPNTNNPRDCGNFVNFLLKKLSTLEPKSDLLNMNINQIHFKPFINGCNTNQALIDNINDPDIINYDYSLFMAPIGCIEGKDCQANFFNFEDYIDEYFKINDKATAIRISNKINNIACPISWYKEGEFEMTCLTTQA